MTRATILQLRTERSLADRDRRRRYDNNWHRRKGGRDPLSALDTIGLLRPRHGDEVKQRLGLVREAKRRKEATCGCPILTDEELRGVLPE